MSLPLQTKKKNSSEHIQSMVSILNKKSSSQLLSTRYWFSFFRCRKTIPQLNDYFFSKISSVMDNQSSSYIIFRVLHNNLYSDLLFNIFNKIEKRRVCFDVYCHVYFMIVGTLMQKIFQQIQLFPERHWNQWNYWNGQRRHQQDIKQLKKKSLSSSSSVQNQQQQGPKISGLTSQEKKRLTSNDQDFIRNYLSKSLATASIGETFLSSDKQIVTKCIPVEKKFRFDLEYDTLKNYYESLGTDDDSIDYERIQRIMIMVDLKKKEFDMIMEREYLKKASENWDTFQLQRQLQQKHVTGDQKTNKIKINYSIVIPYVTNESTLNPFLTNMLMMKYCPGTPLSQISSDDICSIISLIYFLDRVIQFYKFQITDKNIKDIVLHMDPTSGNVMVDCKIDSDQPTIQLGWIDWGDAIHIPKKKDNTQFKLVETWFYECFEPFLSGLISYEECKQKLGKLQVKNDINTRTVFSQLTTCIDKCYNMMDEISSKFGTKFEHFWNSTVINMLNQICRATGLDFKVWMFTPKGYNLTEKIKRDAIQKKEKVDEFMKNIDKKDQKIQCCLYLLLQTSFKDYLMDKAFVDILQSCILQLDLTECPQKIQTFVSL